MVPEPREGTQRPVRSGGHPVTAWLYYWIRFGIPSAILAVGIWWLLTTVIGSVPGV